MRVAIDRRAERQRHVDRFEHITEHIKDTSAALQKRAADEEEARRARFGHAATLINAGARGHLGRNIGRERRLEKWAAICMQRHIRGVLGRMLAEEERWKLVRVAPSKYSLNLMRIRSTITMERGPKNEKMDWVELFDPMTNAFWYLNRRTGHSTWTPPEPFDADLFCMWEPWPYPYDSKCVTNQPCRCKFTNMSEFQQHRINKHTWFCPACDHKNPSLVFPNCTVCGNRTGPLGQNLETDLKDKFNKVFHEWKHPPQLVVDPDELTDEEETLDVDELGTPSLFGDTTFTGSALNTVNLAEAKEAGRGIGRPGSSSGFGQPSGSSGGSLALPGIPGALGSRPSSSAGGPPRPGSDGGSLPGLPGAAKKAGHAGGSAGGQVTPQHGGAWDKATGGDGMPPGGAPDKLGEGMAKPPVPADGRAPPLGVEGGIDDAPPRAVEATDSKYESVGTEGGNATQSTHSQYLKVCSRFQRGWCAKSTCSMAHPGLRDAAELIVLSGTGRRKKYAVKVCAEALASCDWNTCPSGKTCPFYHPYVRPATIEIIRKLYPTRHGRKTKVYKSGAELDGMMDDNHPYDGSVDYNGYAVFSYPNGDTYIGDWKRGVRDGLGIFRSATGKEFVGQWSNGLRHGWGTLTHANGEVYEGDWLHGRISGVGRLTSANGDVYDGQFLKGKYHGLGRFRKSNGDVYLGYCEHGKAEGVGVLALATGEKYKGRFKRDVRHGRGVCIYPNKCKYAGQWERGFHHGFGVFVTPSGERYVGEWHNSTKHGKGRYFFRCGDFYDGDFRKDKAEGQGIYRYAASGNVYAGVFSDDRKNGRGIYVWQSGSRFEGWWVDNDIHGKGVLHFANGAKYQGEFNRNLKHGRGIFTWNTKNRYKGEFVDDLMDGFGEMVYETTGHRYVGQWRNNKKNGEGTFTYTDGNVYSGIFVDDIKQGRGILTYMPGSILQESYEGEFDKGERHGYGIYRYKEQMGLVYEGQWHRGLRHGKGTLRYADGRFYRGDFVKERMSGRGLYVWPDGSQYEGEWKDNERHGEGTYLSANGTIYQGRFWKNLKHGPGVLTYIDGNSYRGEWDGGHIKGVGRFDFHPTDEDGQVVHLKVFGF